MMIEKCGSCFSRKIEHRCFLCKRGYCNHCMKLINGLCVNCLKR